MSGDRFVRPIIRRILRGKAKQLSGVQIIVINFLKGLDRRGIKYRYNRASFFINGSNTVISFGRGAEGVRGLSRYTPVISAVCFPYPREFPDLCKRYNVKKFLQHSRWVLDYVRSANIYDDGIFDLWPAGVDVEEWRPVGSIHRRDFDVLIYNKLRWDIAAREADLVQPIRQSLTRRALTFCELRYGAYGIADYKDRLSRSKVMIFISEHESQGLAYQECMAADVPVFAWDQGYWLDPDRFKHGRPMVPATSVPFFDERCGMKFVDFADFEENWDAFFNTALYKKFRPREYVVENLSIEKSTDRMLEIYESV